MSSNNLSAAVTGEHVDFTLSPTYFQLMGRDGKPGESGKYNPNAPKHMPPKDPGVGTASPAAALLGASAPVPRITKSRKKFPASWSSWDHLDADGTL
jgi:hypothetical protein